MKKIITIVMAGFAIVAMVSCQKENHSGTDASQFYKIVNLQPNVGQVIWNPDEFDFDKGNAGVLEIYAKMAEDAKAGACSSWRNGRYHGRNLDWLQEDYGCLVLQMPSGKGVKHASVSIVNGNLIVNREFMARDIVDEKYRHIIPCMAIDGINDAGVTANINMLCHTPGDTYINKEECDISSSSVVRYILDNAGSVDEAISLLNEKKICQDVVQVKDYDAHFMISDPTKTAAVEFLNKKMVVTYYNESGHGCRSDKGNPAIMTNLCNFAVENWGLGTDDFYDNRPLAMGVERWETILSQYDVASRSVNDNFDIAKSVWYFKNYMSKDKLWYTENAGDDYGRDEQGWYCTINEKRIACSGWKEAQVKAWDTMPKFWADYDEKYGHLKDPHVRGNDYWETSHTVIYDLQQKKGYLCAFEAFYSKDAEPIEISLPAQN